MSIKDKKKSMVCFRSISSLRSREYGHCFTSDFFLPVTWPCKGMAIRSPEKKNALIIYIVYANNNSIKFNT